MNKVRMNVQYDYVLSKINNGDKTIKLPAEKLEYFAKCFNEDYNSYFSNDAVSLQNRVMAFLIGLPECVNIDHEPHKIISLGVDWGFCKTHEESLRFVDGWFKNMSQRIIGLSKMYKVDLNKKSCKRLQAI